MLFRRKRRYGNRRRTEFYLEEERSRARASGSGIDEYVRIKDETGGVWTGIIESFGDDQARYYLSNGRGQRITGLASSSSMVFRDDEGRTWRGFFE